MNKQQLANRIWASANKMRSKIEANEYKDYILGLIFYKFLSDNEVSYLKSHAGWTDEDLSYLVEDYNNPDAAETIDYCKKNIGYFIEYKNLFSTWLLPETPFNASDLNVALGAFDRLVNTEFDNVYKGIFKTLQAGLQKLGENPAAQTKALKELIKLIKDIPTDGKQDYDVLGYVYEYLISNFAASAGKKAGEFYTPHEVAQVMSEIVAYHHRDKESIQIYDPTSGSGSLLITIGKSVGKHMTDINHVKYYAQELKENTYNLTRMNLVMRGISPSNIETRCADSLDEDWPMADPQSGRLEPLRVDAVVSNPPYSQNWDTSDAAMDPRFKDYGIAPKSKADYAFLLHELHHLDANGIMTIVLPHGVLFRGSPDDGSEGEIRSKLIEKNHIDAIIGLPANIFFGTSIPTLIMVLKQQRSNDDVLIIDASKSFVKDGKSNKLRDCDIKKIADTVRDRAEIDGFSRRVSRDEIRKNGYNLNIPRYVDSSEPAEKYDIYATLFGGIPNSEIDALENWWKALPSLRNELFAEDADRPYSQLKVEDVGAAIQANSDVACLNVHFNRQFAGFADMLHSKLIDSIESVRELAVVDEISSEIFRRLQNVPLVDRYAAYQALSDNWKTVSGDIEVIQTEGINACRVADEAFKTKKDKDGNEVEVPDGLKGRIIPFEVVQRDKFQSELDSLVAKRNRLEDIDAELDEIRDGFTEDEQEAYLDDDNEKFDKKRVNADAKKKGDDLEIETKDKLKKIVALWKEQTETKKLIKSEESELQSLTVNALENLSDDEIKQFLHKEWIEPICHGIEKTLHSALTDLERKISDLSKKYAVSYKSLEEQLKESESELAELVPELTGDEYAIAGLKELIGGLGHE